MENKIYSIYGARPSKKGNGYNLVIVTGQGDDKKFFNVYVKNDRITTDGKVIFVSVKLLEQPKIENVEDEDELIISEDDLPF